MNIIWYPYSGPCSVDGKRTCPVCSEYTGRVESWCDPPKLVTPVYLVKRINGKTKELFWGCPNFPKCKFSYQKPRQRYTEIFPEGIASHDLQG